MDRNDLLLNLSVNTFVALVEEYLGDDAENARQALIEAARPNKSLLGIVNATAMKFAKRMASDFGEETMKEISSFFGEGGWDYGAARGGGW